MKLYNILVVALPLLLGACVSDAPPPPTGTTRLTSASPPMPVETPTPAPALREVNPEVQVEAARIERNALQRELDRERRLWLDAEAARRERDAAITAVWPRYEAADKVLAQMKASLQTAAPAERARLRARVSTADAARADVERRMHQVMGGGEWPTAKTDLSNAIETFEESVR